MKQETNSERESQEETKAEEAIKQAS